MEAYLPKCLGGLLIDDKELLQKLDVIVVNDGSKDRTSEIAHEFEAKYPSVFRVIDKPNGNYGSCINSALPVAVGKYVKILDADDYFNTLNLVEYLNFLDNTEEELVLSDYDEVDANGEVSLHFEYELPTDTSTSIEDLLLKYRYIPMHTIAYKASIFNDFHYHQTEGVSYTDTQWSILPLARVNKVAYLRKSIYLYLIERSGRTMEAATQRRNAWMYSRIGLESAAQYVANRGSLSGIKKELMDFRVANLCSVIYKSVTINYRNEIKGVDLNEYDSKLKSISKEFYDKIGSFSSCYGRFVYINCVKNWRAHTIVSEIKLSMTAMWVRFVYLIAKIRVAVLQLKVGKGGKDGGGKSSVA